MGTDAYRSAHPLGGLGRHRPAGRPGHARRRCRTRRGGADRPRHHVRLGPCNGRPAGLADPDPGRRVLHPRRRRRSPTLGAPAGIPVRPVRSGDRRRAASAGRRAPSPRPVHRRQHGPGRRADHRRAGVGLRRRGAGGPAAHRPGPGAVRAGRQRDRGVRHLSGRRRPLLRAQGRHGAVPWRST